jgi:UDP-N-acetylmuramoylalanine--D-glutamate ligase
VVEETSNGDVILLSPACSSTDMYNDYKERGEEFRRLTNFI